MSNLFGVSIEALIDDNMNVEKKETKTKKPRKAVLYVFVALLVALLVALAFAIGTNKEEPKPSEESTGIFAFFENIFGIFDKVLDEADKQLTENNKDNNNQQQMQEQFQQGANQMIQGFEKESHNMFYEANVGTRPVIFVKSTLDRVIADNRKNTEHIVLVAYNETQTSDEAEIVKIKNSLEEFGQYEVSIDYDETGYVNIVTLKDI